MARALGVFGVLVSVLTSCSKEAPPKAARPTFTVNGVTFTVIDGSWSLEGDTLIGSGGHVESKTELADGAIDLDLEETEGPKGQASIGFRHVFTYADANRANGYTLKVLGNTFNVYRVANTYLQPVNADMKTMSPSGVLGTPKTHLSIHMAGGSFRVEANGSPFFFFDDATFTKGKVALGAETPGHTLRFSNVRLSP